MDKSSRLLSDLCEFRSGTPTNSQSCAYSVFDDHISPSDLDLGETTISDDSDSDFSGGSMDSDDDLEGHLQLLWPQELHSMGLDALKSQEYEAAVKYLSMAQLEWTESLARTLVPGSPIQLDESAIKETWLMAKYLQIANLKGVYKPRHVLAAEFQSVAGATLAMPAST